MVMKKKKFYQNGLYFGCTECGNCCSDTSGYVELTEEEAGNIAEFLGLSETDFLEKFIEVTKDAASLHLKSHENGDCIFLVENRCSIYPARPLQCRTFPFWPENSLEIDCCPLPGHQPGEIIPGRGDGEHCGFDEEERLKK